MNPCLRFRLAFRMAALLVVCLLLGALVLPLPSALAANVKGARTEMIPGTTHPMFEQAPQKYCEIVLTYLAED